MMRNLFVAILFGSLLFTGCSKNACSGSKKDFLRKYNELIETAMTSELDYSDRKWKKYDEQFRTYVEECYDEHEADMSRRERRRFWSKAMSYYYMRYGDGVVEELLDETDRVAQRIRENTEDFWEKHGEDLENIFENLGNDLENLFEDLEHDLEDWFEDLEDVLEESTEI